MRAVDVHRHRLQLSVDETGRGQLLVDGVNLSQVVERVTIEVQTGQSLTVMLLLTGDSEATVDGVGQLLMNNWRL
jgi:hypothetical protein